MAARSREDDITDEADGNEDARHGPADEVVDDDEPGEEDEYALFRSAHGQLSRTFRWSERRFIAKGLSAQLRKHGSNSKPAAKSPGSRTPMRV